MANNVNIPLLLQIMDNMLIQVNGRKRVVLYSPKDAVYLYLNGEWNLWKQVVVLVPHICICCEVDRNFTCY